MSLSLSLIAIAIALRVALIFRYRFDSDEPQHMHIAWGWAHGLAQYRDLFDNHMPLFHLLSAPLFAYTGDDPRLLFAARLAMLPLFITTLILVWFVARRLFDETTAFWSAAVAALIPPFFLGSLEYRTDDLWVMLWVGVIAVAVSALPVPRKALYGGLLLGAAFGVSMKSTLYVMALALALLVTFLLTMRRGALPSLRVVARSLLLVLAGVVVVPALVCGAMAVSGLWKDFIYGAFLHNNFPWEHKYKVLWAIPGYFLVRVVALRIARSEGEGEVVRMRLFVCLAAGAYLICAVAFWPMTALESYLPFYPLVALLATPLLLRRRNVLMPAFAVVTIVAIVVIAQPWRNEARKEIALVDDVLAMTGPRETVMDLKGESVFRRRPYYFVLEAITNIKLRAGILRDQIAEHLVSSRTHVVVSDDLPPKAKAFVHANYVAWGTVNVAGVQLPRVSGAPVEFALAIPGPYVVIGDDGGILEATIDGVWVGRDGVQLAAGKHRLRIGIASARPMVIWSGALRRRHVARVPEL